MGSAMMMSTTLLTTMLHAVHLPAMVCKMSVEFSGWTPSITKLKSILALARHTVNLAPMLAILFDWTRTRALQIDPKHGRHQRQAQVCLYVYTVFVYVQTLVVIFMPFVHGV